MLLGTPGYFPNYDETNLTSDFGNKKIFRKRGRKYWQRVVNISKASISSTYCWTTSEVLLAPTELSTCNEKQVESSVNSVGEEWIKEKESCIYYYRMFSLSSWRNYMMQWHKMQPVISSQVFIKPQSTVSTKMRFWQRWWWDSTKILQRLPQKREDKNLVSETFLGILFEIRTESCPEPKQQRKRVKH